MRVPLHSLVLLTVAIAAMPLAARAEATISVDVNHPGHPIPSTLWGIFFEDINLSADGGLYPELVRNRSFEDSDQPEYWKLSNTGGGQSEISVDDSRPLNPFNRHCLRVKVDGSFTVENDGYWGMNIVQGQGYRLWFAARMANGLYGPLRVRLVGADGTELAQGEVPSLKRYWQYHSLDLKATGTDPKAKLEISGSGRGLLFLDMVSLMPKKTWKNHGLRMDLAQAVNALHPSFMRFPGGNWVEGNSIPPDVSLENDHRPY